MRRYSDPRTILRTCAFGLTAIAAGCGSDESGGQGEDGASGGGGETGALTDGAATDGGEHGDSDDGDGGGSNSDSASGDDGGSGSDSDSDGGECPPAEPLCNIPEAELVPVAVPVGLPRPTPGVYDDPEVAPEDQEFRALIGLPLRDRAALMAALENASTPGADGYGQHLGLGTVLDQYAPTVEDFALVETWLKMRGFSVNFTASNRLLIQFSGTVGQFNSVFATELLVCMRENPRKGLPPFPVYCSDAETLLLPGFVADRTYGIVSADLPAATGELPKEVGQIVDEHPGDAAFDPAQIAGAYGLEPLYEAGFTGQGVTLGVVAGATWHTRDLETFLVTFGIERAAPVAIELMEPVVTRFTETNLDVQWASALAPGAAIKVYEGPDARNTSLLYTFNEAIARAEVDVLTDSFDHREDSEPQALRRQYDESALMAAALGITVVGASGNSARPDIPCSSPHVTCVGGTELTLTDDGEVESEVAWEMSGSGDTLSFPRPHWQDGLVDGPMRAVCDLAINGSEERPYWMRRFGEWELTHGTSVGAPAFAAMIAVIDSARAAEGRPRVGFLNPTLYLDPAVRGSFRDITVGETEFHAAGDGWDYPTGWGAPNASALAAALP